MLSSTTGYSGHLRNRLLAGLAAYVTLLWLYRPRTPFEWDEVLFLNALERYDVGTHSPHPPGYPLYVAAGKVLALLTGDPLLGLQLLSVLAAGSAVALLWVLARRLGLGTGGATAAAAVMALTPAFAFNANVGLSDVPSVAATLAAALLLHGAIAEPRRLPWAAAATAAAAGIRPQLVAILLPLGVAALAVAVRGRRWRHLIAATGTGVLVSAAIWGPAIALTGLDTFVAKLGETARWMAVHEADGRIGGAGFEPLLRHWAIYPLVRAPLAIPLWGLLVWGALRLARGRHRTALLVAAGSAGTYLVVALFTLHMSTSVRYVLPAIPFLALLAGGLATPGGRPRLRFAALVAWLVAAVIVAGPAYEVRARRPAPAWEALEWIAARPLAERRTVVVMDEFSPHARYVLAGSGSTVVDPEPGSPCPPDGTPAEGVMLLTRFPVPEAPTQLQRWWNVDAVTCLGRRRYQRATVSRLPADGSPRFSPDWAIRADGVELREAGSISLPAGASPWTVRFTPDREVVVRQGDREPRHVGAAAELELAVLPGPDGVVRIDAPPGRPTSFTALAAGRFAARATLLVGPVAHTEGVGGALWRSDLVLRNPAPNPVAAVVELLLQGRPNPAPASRMVSVPAQGELRLDDVVQEAFATDGAAFLRVLAERGDVAAAATTYDARRPAASRVETVGLPAPPPVPAGEPRVLRGLVADRTRHSNVGVLNLEARPIRLTASLVADDGRALLVTTLDLGPGEVRLFADALRPAGGSLLRARAVFAPVDRPASFLAWGTVVDSATGASTLIPLASGR